MGKRRTVAYTLGMLVRPIAGSLPNVLQKGAAGGPIDEVRGTSSVLESSQGRHILKRASRAGLHIHRHGGLTGARTG